MCNISPLDRSTCNIVKRCMIVMLSLCFIFSLIIATCIGTYQHRLVHVRAMVWRVAATIKTCYTTFFISHHVEKQNQESPFKVFLAAVPDFLESLPWRLLSLLRLRRGLFVSFWILSHMYGNRYNNIKKKNVKIKKLMG